MCVMKWVKSKVERRKTSVDKRNNWETGDARGLEGTILTMCKIGHREVGYSFEVARRANHLRGEPISMTEMQERKKSLI